MNGGMSHEDRQWLEGRLRDVRESLGRESRAMEGRLTMQIVELREQTTRRLDNHADRLRVVETWRSWIMGLSAAAGAGASWIVQVFREGRGP